MATNGLLGQKAEQTYRSPEDLQAKRGVSMLGAALIEEGFKDLGSPGTGKAVAEYLRNEWHRQEANTFQETVGKRVSGALDQQMNTYKLRTKLTTEIGAEGQDPAELRKGYYTEYDPEGAPVLTSFLPLDDPMAVNQHLNTAASDLIGGLQNLSMEYMDAAGEYPNNPLIENKAKALMGHIQSTFEGQLTAAKIAGENMAQQGKLLDLEKKQDEARLRELTMPTQEKLAVAAAEQELSTIEQGKLKIEAMQESGADLARAAGLDADALSPDDKLRIHYKNVIDMEKAAKQTKIASERNKGMLPPGVGPENIEAFFTYDPRGKGLYKNFVTEQEDIAARNPEVKAQLDRAAYELQLKAKVPKTQIKPYKDLPDNTEKVGSITIIGKDFVKERVFVDDPQMAEQIRARAMPKAIEYVFGSGPMAVDAGIKPRVGISPELADQPHIFNSADEAARVTHPELYTAENEEKYAPKLEDPEYSGDPDDPFGPPAEEPESPVSEGAEAREAESYQTWEKWYDEFGRDKDVPLKERKRKARQGIADITMAIDNMATRQSLNEYGLPTEAYKSQIQTMQDLRRALQVIVNTPAGKDVPETLLDDLGDIWESAADSIGTVAEIMTTNHDNVIKNTERSLRYLGFDPKGRTAEVVGGIIDPLGAAVKNREAIIDQGVPLNMASPEEQARRKAQFNKTLKTGLL